MLLEGDLVIENILLAIGAFILRAASYAVARAGLYYTLRRDHSLSFWKKTQKSGSLFKSITGVAFWNVKCTHVCELRFFITLLVVICFSAFFLLSLFIVLNNEMFLDLLKVSYIFDMIICVPVNVCVLRIRKHVTPNS